VCHVFIAGPVTDAHLQPGGRTKHREKRSVSAWCSLAEHNLLGCFVVGQDEALDGVPLLGVAGRRKLLVSEASQVFNAAESDNQAKTPANSRLVGPVVTIVVDRNKDSVAGEQKVKVSKGCEDLLAIDANPIFIVGTDLSGQSAFSLQQRIHVEP
jgi:hypothetical protein